MKTQTIQKQLSPIYALIVTSSIVGALVACGGGGGGGGSSTTKVTCGGKGQPACSSSGSSGSQGPIDTGTNMITSGSSGSGGFSGSSGSGGTSGCGGTSGSSGCDASGCNSFQVGGSKNTGLLAKQMSEEQIQTRAMAVSSQFQMDYDSAYKLTQLANQVLMMKTQGQMTDADRAAVLTSAYSIGGVQPDEVNTAIAASQSGNNGPVNDLLDKVAGQLGMPSGATIRDKILPAFGVHQ